MSNSPPAASLVANSRNAATAASGVSWASSGSAHGRVDSDSNWTDPFPASSGSAAVVVAVLAGASVVAAGSVVAGASVSSGRGGRRRGLGRRRFGRRRFVVVAARCDQEHSGCRCCHQLAAHGDHPFSVRGTRFALHGQRPPPVAARQEANGLASIAPAKPSPPPERRNSRRRRTGPHMGWCSASQASSIRTPQSR